ncbi:EF-hand domain-containing family member C2-like [Daktulosphaira vitifoliae]|uniref:EF-hand domain-containing family member C2-like n=1 Tax=Daktulosphaira vitifoliae TaxID=58002 RepID=UPI0021AA34F9|nr:EF-hand domain-containing family member C2-like [Daktulosphaira vitifoliae]
MVQAKNGKFLKPIGYDEEKQLLKVMGKSIDTKYQWYALDSQHAGYSVENTYYNASDLYIGAQLFIYNRLIILTECDEFTKNYYKNVYGLKSFASVVPPKTKRQKLEEELNKIRNATLIKSRDQNVLKRLRSEADNHVFIFKAKMVSNDPINLSRHFLLKYFFNSNTFGIYEITEPNSGVIGGEFRSKRSISIFDENEKSFIYSEIAVGSKLFIDDFQFVLTDVDDKTLKFMMAHPKEFYHSNVEMLNNQLYDLINTEGSNINKFYDKCFQNRPLVPREIFRQVLHDEFKNELSQHAIAVFALIYKKVERFKEVTDEMFQRVVQNELRRAFFRNFDCLDIAMKQRNIHQINGVLDHDETLKILKTNRVPLLPEIQNRLLTKFTDLENGKVKFKDMIDFMDYLKNPTETPKGVAREILMAKPETVYIQVGKLVDFMQSFKPTYEQ